MEQDGRPRSVAVDLGPRAAVVGELDELARRIRERLRRRKPEAQLGERVAERLREDRADLLRGPAPVADLVLERAHAPHPVVARPAEASVDEILDAPPEGEEPDGDDERRHRRDPLGAAADEDPEPDRQACEAPTSRVVSVT